MHSFYLLKHSSLHKDKKSCIINLTTIKLITIYKKLYHSLTLLSSEWTSATFAPCTKLPITRPQATVYKDTSSKRNTSMSTNSNLKNCMPPKKNRHLSLSMSQRRKPLSTRYKRYQPNFQHPLPTIPKTFNPNLKRNPSFIPARERQFLTISKEYQRSRTSLTPPNTIKLITMFISPNLKATWVRLIILISCSLKCEGH